MIDKNKEVVLGIIKEMLLSGNMKVRLKYFVTFTFRLQGMEKLSEEMQEEIEIKKDKTFKYFLKILNNRQRFDYFWVKQIVKNENKENNIHYHMVCDWDFSHNYVKERWKMLINEPEENIPALFIDSLYESKESYGNRINYLFSKEIEDSGMSLNLREDLRRKIGDSIFYLKN